METTRQRRYLPSTGGHTPVHLKLATGSDSDTMVKYTVGTHSPPSHPLAKPISTETLLAYTPDSESTYELSWTRALRQMVTDYSEGFLGLENWLPY